MSDEILVVTKRRIDIINKRENQSSIKKKKAGTSCTSGSAEFISIILRGSSLNLNSICSVYELLFVIESAMLDLCDHSRLGDGAKL